MIRPGNRHLLARLADIPTPAGPRCEIGALGPRRSFRAWISANETTIDLPQEPSKCFGVTLHCLVLAAD
jgi:hypothetical protein